MEKKKELKELFLEVMTLFYDLLNNSDINHNFRNSIQYRIQTISNGKAVWFNINNHDYRIITDNVDNIIIKNNKIQSRFNLIFYEDYNIITSDYIKIDQDQQFYIRNNNDTLIQQLTDIQDYLLQYKLLYV